MAKTAAIYVKIEPEVKKQADEVMNKLGLSASTVINMLYRQIAMEKRIPFESRISTNAEGYPTLDGLIDSSQMTEEQKELFARELLDAMDNTNYTDYTSLSDLKKYLEERKNGKR